MDGLRDVGVYLVSLASTAQATNTNVAGLSLAEDAAAALGLMVRHITADEVLDRLPANFEPRFAFVCTAFHGDVFHGLVRARHRCVFSVSVFEGGLVGRPVSHFVL